MKEILDNKKKFIHNSTIRSIFNKVYKKYPNNSFLASGYSGQNNIRNYTYKEVKKLIDQNILFFKDCSMNIGDRVAIMIGNNPEYFILKLSINNFGLSCVPINNELSSREIKFILENANPKYLIIDSKNSLVKKKIFQITRKNKIGLIAFKSNTLELLKKSIVKSNKKEKFTSKLESSILYTSGTTGIPKGCILTNEYEINAGYSYVKKKGLISMNIGKERLYNCLPVHHVNAGVLSFFAMLITANCQIQAERFSLNNFWDDIRLSKATIFHYLGVMVPLLMKRKKNKDEKKTQLRIGVGAGIEPSLHYSFERRFNVCMIELWGMTEMVRCIFDFERNRKVGKRCFGKTSDEIETKVVDQNGKELINKKGFFFIRYNKENPKKGFFKKYNKNENATKQAWRGGWFNTGDIVIKDSKGYHYFVDRAKNIIRRSGENISSVEVENVLLNINYIVNCAVLSKSHEFYEEEVFAFIILNNTVKKDIDTAKNILKGIKNNLAYYKLPCFIKFIDKMPLTSSQKTNRSKLKSLLLSYKERDYINLEGFKKKFKKVN